MEPINKTNSNSLIIGVIVLLLLVGIAYVIMSNNAADEVNEVTTETPAEVSQEDLARARAEVAGVLVEIQSDINAGVNISTSTLTQRLVNERRDLRSAYQNVTGEVKSEYEQIDRDLGRLETELKGDVNVASRTLGGIMSRLESDLEAGARATWEEIKQAAAALNPTVDVENNIEVSATTSTTRY